MINIKKVITVCSLIMLGISSEIAFSQEYTIYNEKPGDLNANLFEIEKKREITGINVISPDKTKAVFTKTYFYPHNKQTFSRAFFTYINDSKASKPQVILESGTNSMDSNIFRNLTIVDWSADSRKVLIRETVGEYQRGIWATNLWVYDFYTQKAKRLDAVRKAVIYFWKNRQQFHIEDYSWDIVPLGWDISNPDLIIVNAYGYNYKKKHFLGCWSVDADGKKSRFLSLEEENWPVAKSGLVQK